MVSFPNCFKSNNGKCPWGDANAKALFERHPEPPWPKPIKGNPDIAGYGILISFAVTALLFSVCQLILRVLLLWIPKTNVEWDRFNKRSVIRGLRAALLGLEDTLLITGYAFYAAVALDQCALTIYHLKLLSWMFTASYSTGIAIVWSSRDALLYTMPFITRPAHWGEPPGKRGTAAVWGRAAALGGLCGTSLICLVWLARTRIPNFPMPAMGAPAFCFFGHKYPRDFNAFLDNYPFPLLVAGVATAAPGVSWLLAHALAFCGGGAWARRWHARKQRRRHQHQPVAGDGHGAGAGYSNAPLEEGGKDGYVLSVEEVAEEQVAEDDAAGRLVRRLKTVEGVIYASCNLVAVRYAFHVWHRAQPFLEPESSEHDWGFGQIVAVILVAAPVLAFLETLTNFDEHRKKGETLSLPLRYVKGSPPTAPPTH